MYEGTVQVELYVLREIAFLVLPFCDRVAHPRYLYTFLMIQIQFRASIAYIER